MSRFRLGSLPDPAPVDAEAYGLLRFERSEQEQTNGRARCMGLYCKVWRGKSQRPYANYFFHTAEAREKWIEEEKESEDSHEAFRKQQKAEEVVRLAEQIKRFTVGTILHYSWGYDQTQCEFFQVVERRGKRRVILRRIACETVPGSESFMSDSRQPAPNHFCGEPFAKQIGPYGISMAHGSASVCKPDDAFYCSWYA